MKKGDKDLWANCEITESQQQAKQFRSPMHDGMKE
jgi:hypothetical protein